MKTQTKKHSQGNWITFLSGALFNVMANMALNNTIHYSLHALVGGIVFLFFKILSDTLVPHITSLGRSLWKKVNSWTKSRTFVRTGERESKYPERSKTPRV